jgi:RHS repeat-associated protein
MSRADRRPGLLVHTRPIVLALLMAASGVGIQAIPPEVPLPLDRPAALQPSTAAAVTCATHPEFSGHLTSSSASTATLSRITNPNVYHYISNIGTDWSCDSFFRYSGTAWNTTATTGTFKWGNLFNSTSPSCYWIVGTNDYTKANSTTDCPDTIAEYAYGFALSPQGVYQKDVVHDSVGDFSFAHSACDIYLGASVTKTSAYFGYAATNNRPGAANCDQITLDGQNDNQTVTYDATTPTTAFTTPAGSAGTTVYRNTTASYNVVRTITEAVAGFGGANTWKLQRQIASITAPNTCGTFANDPATGNYTTGTTTGSVSTAQTLVAATCYRWLANATDQNGNVAAQVTSATVLVDTVTPAATYTTPPAGTTVLNGTSYSVAWTETDAHAGVLSRSLQRRIATYSGGSCSTYANDGGASTSVSPKSETGLVDGKCYQWIQTLTDRAGNVTATTSGTVRIDIGSPSANFSTPDEGSTITQSSTSYTVAWTETAGSGSITARSLQRQKGIVTSGSCAGVSFANDGSPSTAVSPVNVTGLLTGNCYRWIQTLTNSVPKSGATTSGSVLVDTTAPGGTIVYPEANRAVGGIVTVTGTATDADSYRDYTVDYGAGTSPSSWTTLVTSSSQVAVTATLTSWDTRPLAGVYTVRLTVRDWAGNTSAVVTSLVYLENALRGEEAYLARVPFDLGGGWNLQIGVANGEATLARDLFSIPSYGPPQALSLTYSSLESTSTGRFGYGWSSNLTQYLSFESGFVVWHRADGGRVPFGQIGGTWTPLRGHFETLTSAGSEYTVTLKDQTKLVFENSGNGRLKRVENRFAKALTLVWNTSTATATDASGRVTNVTIDSANNRITGLTDSAGRTWSFGYAPSINDLTTITDPAGKMTTLAYDASHRLTTMTRTRTPASGPVETITWTVGYTSGKATSVTDPVNTSVSNSFTYNANDTTVGLLKTYNPQVRNTTTYAFDAVGLGRAVSITDPEGWVTIKAYDADSNLTSIIRPVDAGPPADYQTLTYQYDARGNVTSETAELDSAGTVVTTASWYNASNDLIVGSEADNDASLKLVTKYAYDGSGHLTSININCTTSGTTSPADASTCTGAGTQDASTNLITTYTYTTSHQLLDETDPFGRVTRHSYDTYGNETSTILNYINLQPPTADINVSTVRDFNQATTAGKAGLVTSLHTWQDPEGDPVTTTYTYDSLGRQLTEALPGDTTIPALTRAATYDELGNVLTETESWTGVTRTTTHVYEKANRETSLTDGAGVVTTTAYDATGNAITSVGGGVTTTRTFDGLGRATAETVDGNTTTHTYDPAGNERQTVDPAGVTTTRVLDRGGREISEAVEDVSGELTTLYVYDHLGHLTSSTDPTGAITTTTYDRPGKTLTQTVAGAPSTTAYDRAGNLLSTKNPGGDVSATVVDALNRMKESIANCTNSGTTQPAAGVVCTGTGTHDQATNITTTTYYDPVGETLATMDPSGNVTRSLPNVRGLTWKSIANCTNTGTVPPPDPATCAGTGTADAKTNVASTVTFDGSGATLLTVTSVGLGDEATADAAYDAAGRLVASRDGLGTVSRTFYDSSGRVSSQVVNCTNTGATVPTSGWEICAATGTHDASWNVTTAYTYDANGNRDTETAPNGRVTRFVYDAAGRVIERTENYTTGTPAADQNLTTYSEYDPAGRLKAVRAPTVDRTTFAVTAYAYDDSGRVFAEVLNCTVSGTTPPAEPDWRGCGPVWDTVTSSWLSMGTSNASTNIITSYAYDGRGNRLRGIAPDPSDASGDVTYVTTQYAYDAADRLCRVLEAADASVNLQLLADPCATTVSGTATSNMTTRYTYDAAGNLTSMIDGRGNTTTYGYDASGRMTSLADALTHAVGWTYDALGRRTGQSNRDGTSVTWTYDGAGRVLTRAATGVATVTYGYDDNGNRLTAGDGTRTITTTYERLNRPTQVMVSDDAGATTTSTYSFTSPTWSDASGAYILSVDKFGRETSLLDPIHGASAWTSTYRADGQQATLAAPNGNTTSWTHDAVGRPTGSATTATGPVTRASYVYTLNRAGQRLSEASTITGDPTNGTVTFAYDPLARLTGYSGAPVTSQTYAWDKVPNRTSKQVGGAAAVTTTYDVANRLTSDSVGGTYANDLDGRLTGRPGQTLVWDALGRLIQVKDPVTQANISSYTYDPLDRLLTVSNGSGLTKFRYVGETSHIAQARDLNNVVLYNVGTSFAGSARLDWGTGGTNQRYYGINGHRDLTWTADMAGTVTASLRSDPWGIPGTSTGGSLPSFRFQGGWYDISSAVSWVVARWYSPSLGRFVSEDSVLGSTDVPPSRHLYAYGGGEPIAHWDPDGRFWYKVRSGDTIKSIAYKFWGTTSRWPTIFNANRNRIHTTYAYVKAGQCLWIRRYAPSSREQDGYFVVPDCDPAWLGEPSKITGNPDERTRDAAATLGITNFYNLSRQNLIALTSEKTRRLRSPSAATLETYRENTKYLDDFFGLRAGYNFRYINLFQYFAGMTVIYGDPFYTPKNASAETYGHIVFTNYWPNKNHPETDTIMWHEFIHTLQYEGRKDFWPLYNIEALKNGKGTDNKYEALAYLWEGWGDLYMEFGDKAPWCYFYPIDGRRPGC